MTTTLPRRALRAALNLAAMLTAFLVTLVGITLLQDAVLDPPAPRSTVPDVMLDARALMVENDCWSGEAPAALAGLPTGVVYMAEGDQRVTLGGQEAVGLALGQLFADEDHGLVVFGFCGAHRGAVR